MSDVGRPENFTIKNTEKEIIGIMEIFEDKIFPIRKAKTQKEKAECIEKLASKIQPRHERPTLTKSTILTNLLAPYYSKESEKLITLSYKYGMGIYQLLQYYKAEYKYIDDESLNRINAFKERFTVVEAQDKKSSDQKKEFLKIFADSSRLLDYLAGSSWKIFERYGDMPVKDADWGYAVGDIHFKKGPEYLNVTFTSVNPYGTKVYEGIATTDKQILYLYLDLKDGDNKRLNLVFKLSSNALKSQSIIIGHFTYHSTRYQHLQTKTVVLYIIDKASNALKSLKTSWYSHNHKKLADIPLLVRQLLYPRERNRLSMNKKNIGDAYELHQFLKEVRLKKINPKIKKHFCRKYYVYYKSNTNKITEDDLNIEIDENCLELISTYIHVPDADGENKKKWMGQAFINTKEQALMLELTNEKSTERMEEDPILLSFLIPDDTITYAKAQCFPGIISGLEDATKGPISFICLVVPHNIPGFKRKNDPRVKFFFNKQQAATLYIKDPKFVLNSL